MNTTTTTDSKIANARRAAFDRNATDADRTAAWAELMQLEGAAREQRKADRVADALANRPKVGDGASFTVYSDTKACTVIAVSKSGKTVTLQEDHAELLNGFDSAEADALVSYPGGFAHHVEGRQRYDFSRNPAGSVYKVTLRNNGEWKLAGHATKSPGCVAHMGKRSHHYDYNF